MTTEINGCMQVYTGTFINTHMGRAYDPRQKQHPRLCIHMYVCFHAAMYSHYFCGRSYAEPEVPEWENPQKILHCTSPDAHVHEALCGAFNISAGYLFDISVRQRGWLVASPFV